MDIKELVKLQMVSQMGNQGSQQQQKNIFVQILLMALMSLLDDIVKAVPRVFESCKMIMFDRFQKKVQETIEKPKTLADISVGLNEKHPTSTLSLRRIFEAVDGGGTQKAHVDNSSEESNQIVDALLAQISKMNNVPTFTLLKNGQFMVTYKEKPIQLTKDIFIKIEDIVLSQSGSVSSLKLTLLSNVLSASEITSYVKNLHQNYLQELKTLWEIMCIFSIASKKRRILRLHRRYWQMVRHY